MDDDPFLSFIQKSLEAKSTISAKTQERASLLLKELSNPLINFKKVKTLCFSGIPDECQGLRALLWRMLLGYLPPNRGKWESLLKQNRKNYQEFVHEFILKKANNVPKAKEGLTNTKSALASTKKPQIVQNDDSSETREETKSMQSTGATGKKTVVLLDASGEDHPLSTSKTSQWNTFFKDQELWDEVEKDTKRTRREISLFGQATSQETVYSYTKQINKDESERHSDVLSRILFIYGKLNPGIRYVQGMNELLAPIYYCFISDENPVFANCAEVDAFYCFSNLMSEAKENFVKALDNTDSGIKFRITALNNLLRRVDQGVWQHLRNLSVNPQYYSLRWLMLMLTQEFQLVDVLRLWDSLLSVPERNEFLMYCCLAMILNAKESIVDEDFPTIMQVLQRNAANDVELVIRKAFSLYKNYGNANDLNQFTLGL